MLVLSRKKGEEIALCVEGQTVRVRIVNVNGKTVRLGIEAPEDVLVHRKEVGIASAQVTARHCLYPRACRV